MPTGHVFCSACGASNEVDAVYCENCGKRRRTVAAPRSAPDFEPYHSAGRTPTRSRWVVVIPLVLVLGAAAAWALRSRPQTNSVELAPLAQNLTLSDQPVAGGSSGLPQNVPMVAVAPPAAPAGATQPRQQPVRQTLTPSPTTASQSQLTAPPELSTSAAHTATTNPDSPAGSSYSAAPPDVPTPAEAAPPPVPRIASGTSIQLRSLQRVCSDKNKESELFRTVVNQQVEGSNGAMIPKGAVVTFIIDRLNRSGGKVEFSVAPLSVQLNGSETPIIAGVDAVELKKANKGLLGAVVGAAAGIAAAKAAGGDTKAAVLGGAAGGAAGTLIGKQLQNADGCIETNAPIKITLRSDLTPP